MPLLILRAIFVMVSIGIAVSIFNSEVLRGGPAWVPWVVLAGMVALPCLVIGVDATIRRKDLTVVTAVYFGMLGGVFLTYVASLALVPSMPAPPRSPVFDWLPLILGMILCYICTSLLLQTRNDFRFIIPYVEFARDVQGMRPNLLDSSAIIDGRIADLAEAGIFESRFAVPSCVVDDLQAAAESTDKLRRMRGRRGLDVLARLRESTTPARRAGHHQRSKPREDRRPAGCAGNQHQRRGRGAQADVCAGRSAQCAAGEAGRGDGPGRGLPR